MYAAQNTNRISDEIGHGQRRYVNSLSMAAAHLCQMSDEYLPSVLSYFQGRTGSK